MKNPSINKALTTVAIYIAIAGVVGITVRALPSEPNLPTQAQEVVSPKLKFHPDINAAACQKASGRLVYRGEIYNGYVGCLLPEN